MIDHADVIETRDGEIVLAVHGGDLEYGPKIVVQVGDDYFDIVQSSLVFGHVDRIPRHAIEMLRGCKTLRIAEVIGDERKVVAVHEAFVRDLSVVSSDDIASDYGRFRNRLQKMASAANKGKEYVL